MKPWRLTKKNLIGSSLLLIAGGVLGLAGWMRWLDPRLREWGARPQEKRQALPGDDWIGDAIRVRTRAISIKAPPEAVWPWLLQLGAGRGGFFTFAPIEILRTRKHTPAHQLDPELKPLELGDPVELGPGMIMKVVQLNPACSLVLGSPLTLAFAWSWAFVLEPEPGGTRLLIRERQGAGAAPPLKLIGKLYETLDNAMSWKMLQGIRARAEARHESCVCAGPETAPAA